MSALLPGFTRRRVQTGEVAPHAAVGGDGPLACGHFLAEEQQRASRAGSGDLALAGDGHGHGAPSVVASWRRHHAGRVTNRLVLPVSGWRATAATDSTVTSAPWTPAPPSAAASRAASPG
jgi:hypothetical protein